MGPVTGRAAGFCAGYGVPGYANPIPGRGFGMGFGRGFWGRGGGGRGYRHMYYATGMPGWARAGGPYPAAPYAAPPTAEQELAVLRQQAEYLGNALEDIRKRIEDIEAKPAEK